MLIKITGSEVNLADVFLLPASDFIQKQGGIATAVFNHIGPKRMQRTGFSYGKWAIMFECDDAFLTQMKKKFAKAISSGMIELHTPNFKGKS